MLSFNCLIEAVFLLFDCGFVLGVSGRDLLVRDRAPGAGADRDKRPTPGCGIYLPGMQSRLVGASEDMGGVLFSSLYVVRYSLLCSF